MLSRTADDLYWMSRYLERAENMARMLGMSHALSLMPKNHNHHGLDELALPLNITGHLGKYMRLHGALDAHKLLHFFALDENHSGSIYHCIKEARSNAHAVRGSITQDMWENINATWLFLQHIASQGIEHFGLNAFCEWVKDRAHLFRGASQGTILRGDAFHFIHLGMYIERADNTLRLLDARYKQMGKTEDNLVNETAHGYYQWSALLRALSLFESYTTVYGGSPSRANVTDLMILRSDAPRSLRSCLDQIDTTLRSLPGTIGRNAQRAAAEFTAYIHFTGIEDILDRGLHDWISESSKRIHQLATGIQKAYFEHQLS